MAPVEHDDRSQRDAPRPDRRRWLWTAPHRRAIAGLVLLACGLLATRQLGRPATVPDRQATYPPRFNDLADRLDPNTASVAELGVLPGLGPSKAGAIVAYRESVGAPPAFRTAADLSRVRGIGPAMVAKLTPYLEFPERRDANRGKLSKSAPKADKEPVTRPRP